MLSKIKIWLKNNKRNLLVIFAIFILDRVSKIIALRTIAVHGPKEVFKYFSFTYVENTGAAFSMLTNGNLVWIFVVAAVLVFIIKSWKEISAVKEPWAEIGLCLIVGGALGNLYDRIFLGFVVDMFDFKVWPVFNIADSFVCIGAGLILIAIFLGRKKKELK